MGLQTVLRDSVKFVFGIFGFDIVRQKNSPESTMLGLRQAPFHTIIDVGANSGQFAKRISGVFPQASLYCFEPLPDPFDELTLWADTKNGRVTTYNLAIGDTAGEVDMYLHDNHTPSSSILATTALSLDNYPIVEEQTRIRVKQMTLDGALQEASDELTPEVLVKLDVQGYEDRVISGGSEVLARASACIVEVCLDSLYEGQARFSKLVSMLESLGFAYAGNLQQTYGEDGHCAFLDAVFIRRA